MQFKFMDYLCHVTDGPWNSQYCQQYNKNDKIALPQNKTDWRWDLFKKYRAFFDGLYQSW